MTTSHKTGSLGWLQATHGRLTFKTRMALLKQALAPTLDGLAKMWLKAGKKVDLKLQDIPLPDSYFVRHAWEELESCSNASVVQHSIRTYLWGAGLGAVDGIAFDPEFLLVTCLLHDLSMSDRHYNHRGDCHCFAGDSALAAQTVMRAADWPANKVERMSEAICEHMNGQVPLSSGNEAHLLYQGASCDVIGARLFDFDNPYRQAVLDKHPRLGMNRVFSDFMAKEARLRPASRGALMQQVGLPLMIRTNPFEE